MSYTRGKLMLLQWQHNRKIFMLSTKHTNGTRLVPPRCVCVCVCVCVCIPEVLNSQLILIGITGCLAAQNQQQSTVITLILWGGGIDLTSYYSFVRKSVKWWRKLFFWLTEATVVNSYILYKKHSPPSQSHHYSSPGVSPPADNGPVQPTLLHPTTSLWLSQPGPVTGEALTRQPLPDCRVCSKKCEERTRPFTPFFCSMCSDNSSLCPGDCFQRYHTRRRYTTNQCYKVYSTSLYLPWPIKNLYKDLLLCVLKFNALVIITSVLKMPPLLQLARKSAMTVSQFLVVFLTGDEFLLLNRISGKLTW